MAKRKYLLKVRRSRKAYIPIYLMNLFIIFLLIFLNAKGYTIERSTLIFSIVFVILCVKITEIHRIRDWWAITDSSFIQSTGIFNKNVREVDFSSISDLDLDQHLLKRIFRYGDVNVRLFLNETSIKIKSINKPGEFIEELQKVMSKNRKENSQGDIKSSMKRK